MNIPFEMFLEENPQWMLLHKKKPLIAVSFGEIYLHFIERGKKREGVEGKREYSKKKCVEKFKYRNSSKLSPYTPVKLSLSSSKKWRFFLLLVSCFFPSAIKYVKRKKKCKDRRELENRGEEHIHQD